MRITRPALAVTLALLILYPLGQRTPGSHRDRAQTFTPDSAPEAYRRSVAALMWPGATRSFEVNSAGDL